MMLGRKRIYGGRTRTPVRRKRTYKRTGYRKRRYSGVTSKSGAGSTFNFRSRKLSRRRWNNALWTSTLQKQHVRSVFAVTSAIVSNPDPAVSTVAALRAIQDFYLPANGAQPYDNGVTLPVYNGDVVIRGGMMGLRLINDPADVSPLHVKVYLVKTGDKLTTSFVPNTVSLGWDPSVVPNFGTDVGKVIMERTFLIENSNSAEVRYRIPIMKVDTQEWTTGANQYFWFVLVNSANGLATQLTTQRYFNLSFVGDGI